VITFETSSKIENKKTRNGRTNKKLKTKEQREKSYQIWMKNVR
jgi:hypothetical protein